MKRAFLVAVLLLFVSVSFPNYRVTRSESRAPEKRRLELKVRAFPDLYFYVYKLALASDKQTNVEGLAPAIEAARQLPFSLTPVELIAFRQENAAGAAKAFAEVSETYKMKSGEVVQFREKGVRFGQSLVAVEKHFLDNIWPQHKALLDKAVAHVEQTLVPKEQECFDYLTRHLGMESAEQVVPIFLVAETPWPGGFTMWGKDATHGVCVISVTAYQRSDLNTAILHEAIHALDLETKGKGNVLVELEQRLLKAGFAAGDAVVRNGPHLLVFIHSSETVKRHVDPSYQPYGEGIFARPGLQSIVKVELPNWIDYLDGKISRDEALNRMVDAFVKARGKNAPAN
ncbi:MAG TPA: hypothetical protein VLB87_13290 [Pyrinomonadaceae bacterium]|nr:hypothetical protein [Pyrinomonadaceae bacterium]